MYDTIYGLIEANDLLEANHLLKIIDNALANQSINRSAFCKALSKAIIEWSANSRFEDITTGTRPKYHIFPASNSVPHYLASFGLSLSSVQEMRKNIKHLIADIDETITGPSGICLSIKDEEKVLSTLSNKFPFWEIVSANKTLDILNINNTHRSFNSLCGASGDASSFIVYMFNMKDSSVIPEYVFLHELGHVLQISLTGSDKLVPTEFIEFNKLIKVILEQGTYESAEVFADTFAIAVMRGTDLCKFNPFPFPDELNKTFEEFYAKLFERYRGTAGFTTN